MSTQIFNCHNEAVTFQSENGNVMVNATQMAKPFSKNASHWLRNQFTQEFIDELSALRNRKGSDIFYQ